MPREHAAPAVRGGTFPDATITEGGRRCSAGKLAALSDADVRDLFDAARFPDYHSATDDSRDLDAWATRVPVTARSDPHRRPVLPLDRARIDRVAGPADRLVEERRPAISNSMKW